MPTAKTIDRLESECMMAEAETQTQTGTRTRATWRAWVRLPDDAGARIDAMAARLGILPGVFIRMIVLGYLERASRSDQSFLESRMAPATATTGGGAQREGDVSQSVRGSSWRVWVRLPAHAGAQINRMESRLGVLPGVIIRMIVLDYLEQQSTSREQTLEQAG